MRIVVDLPEPFGPRKPKMPPRGMSKLTRPTAVKLPKRRVTPRTETMAASAGAGVGRRRGRAGVVASVMPPAPRFAAQHEHVLERRRDRLHVTSPRSRPGLSRELPELSPG